MPKAAGQSLLKYIREHLFAGEGRAWLYIGNPDEERAFESMPDEEVQSFEFVGGHVSLAAFQRKLPHLAHTHFTMTVLREPYGRALSLYRYICGYPPHFMHREVARLGFVEFLESQWFPRNHQCRLIDPHASASEAIDIAMKHFDLIGFHDDLDAVTRTLSSYFAFSAREMPVVNVSDFVLHLSAAEETQAREIVARVDAEDVRLYQTLRQQCARV